MGVLSHLFRFWPDLRYPADTLVGHTHTCRRTAIIIVLRGSNVVNCILHPPGRCPEATGGSRAAWKITETGENGAGPVKKGIDYKWVVLSITTIEMFMVSVNGSITLISLPAIFNGININPLTSL